MTKLSKLFMVITGTDTNENLAKYITGSHQSQAEMESKSEVLQILPTSSKIFTADQAGYFRKLFSLLISLLGENEFSRKERTWN